MKAKARVQSAFVKSAAIFVCSLFVTQCVTSSSNVQSLFPVEVPERTRASYQAESDKGMVAAAHPLASQAGIDMLKAGGNAADAAVATSFVISVVRPQSTGIGGGGFLLYHDATSRGPVAVYDFRERAPMMATRDMYLDDKGEPKGFQYRGMMIPDASVNGHLAVGMPGLVAGLWKFHQDHGKLPWGQVVEPAIRAAEQGFPVYKSLASSLENRKEILEKFPSTVKIFFKNGSPLKMGDLLVQTDLGQTLREIARKGQDGFYKGPVADKILSEMRRGGGILNKKDFETYTVKMRQPISGTYRGHKIVSMPPPSSGGVHIVQMLNMLERVDYGAMGHNTSESVHVLAEVMRRAFADRAEYLGDPDFVDVPVEGLVSEEYARKLFDSIDKRQASSSSVVGAGNPSAFESPSTTHLSVVDQWGNAVSSTQTINYSMGSCVVAEGTGVVLNNEMDDFSIKPGVPNAYGLVGREANAIAAGKTMLSSMSPTIVLDSEDRIKLVVGSPGGPRIINATLQTIINVIDHKMELVDAVHAHRIHHQWLPDELLIEKDGLPPEVVKDLTARGHKLVTKGQIGDVHAIIRNGNSWIGVSDTRSEGQPIGY